MAKDTATDLRRVNPAQRTCFQITLPMAHHHILATEADLWSVGRGDFLTMLLRRKRGELVFERPKHAPSYSFEEKDLLATERYAWYLPNQDVPKLEEDRLKMGNISASAWATFILNDWIGRPGGVGEQEIVRRMVLAHINKFLPDEKAPAEPYWGLFEVTDEGKPTGNLWAMAPGEVVLFEQKKEAERTAKFLGPPSDPGPTLTGRKVVGWSPRGVSKEYLKTLKADPAVKIYLGKVSAAGEMVARLLS
jgi:hypothetical protein